MLSNLNNCILLILFNDVATVVIIDIYNIYKIFYYQDLILKHFK